MEPMTLGSPNSSPAGGSSNPYLPSYLTGEVNIHSTPRNNTLSPTKRKTLSFASSPTNVSITSPDFNNSVSLNQKNSLFNQQQLQQQQQQQNTSQVGCIPNLNLTGPPTQGLFDSLREEMYQVQTPKKRILNQSQNLVGQFNQSTNFNESFNDSYINQQNFNPTRLTSPFNPLNLPNSSQQHQTDYTDNSNLSYPINNVNKYADFWVTIFGFPSNATSIILSHFSKIGSIIEKVFPLQNGNWIHIRYSSRLECDKALSYNEKILNNNIMIGVTKCKDQKIIDKENLNDNNQSFKIRPLTQVAYKTTQCESSVIACSPVPQRSSGIMNKAMDLLFGW